MVSEKQEIKRDVKILNCIISQIRMDCSMEFFERPRICTIDVRDKDFSALQEKKFNCFKGTFGPLIRVPNSEPFDSHFCTLDYFFPPNFHEYDIAIIDMQNEDTIPYYPIEQSQECQKNPDYLCFHVSFPQRIFNPRGMSSLFFSKILKSFLKKKSILIVFAGENANIDYDVWKMGKNGAAPFDQKSISLYSFAPYFKTVNNISGKDINVEKSLPQFERLLKKYNSEAVYFTSFHQPVKYENGRQISDPNFLPLMRESTGEIVSFCYFYEELTTLVFPYFSQKEKFMVDLLEITCPELWPDLFPNNTNFSWKNHPEYRLPNENRFLDEKEIIKKDYHSKLEEIESRIEQNRNEYSFLHDLLTQTGTELVKTVEVFLRWLEFENVVNVDETEPKLKQEDLRVGSHQGELLIEIKGIGGTSTDAECSQVNKYKLRRINDTREIDVFGLYIVNHQRYKAPEDRTNPPFNETQIQDANNEKRGLLTTYDLYKTYFNIYNKFLTKADVREAMFNFGLIEFNPSNAKKIEQTFEICHNGLVVIFEILDTRISVGMGLFIKENGYFRSLEIMEIQIDGKPVESVSSGEVGIKLSGEINKNVEIFVPQMA